VEGTVANGIRRTRDRFGFWVATPTALSTAVALTVAVLTPPKGAPFCVENCIGYPYTDFAAHIPRDFLWMYPALFVAPLFVMLLAVMHERAVLGSTAVQPHRHGIWCHGRSRADRRLLHPAAIRAAGSSQNRRPAMPVIRHGLADESMSRLLVANALEPGFVSAGTAVVSAALAFGVYHFAHSPPFNTTAMVLLLSGVRVATGIFFFLGGDLYSTIVLHNAFAPRGVISALGESGNFDRYTSPRLSLIATVIGAVVVLVIADVVLIRPLVRVAPE
jgi:Type II CAAX prenyl endopeptidase Rce1-like